MKLVILANGPYALPMLRELAASEHEIARVIVRPAVAPRGRRAQPSPVHVVADELHLPVVAPPSINDEDSHALLRELQPDLLVVCDYGEILKPHVMESACLGAINLHGSLLPKYRGAAPVQWAVRRGETTTGNTVFQLVPGVDAGPILLQQELAIEPDETAGELEDRLAVEGAKLVVTAVDALANEQVTPQPQDAEQATRAPRIHKQEGKINWHLPAEELKNHVRAMQPWPKAYTTWNLPSGNPVRIILLQVEATRWKPPPVVRAGDTGDVIAVGPEVAHAAHAEPIFDPPGTVMETNGELIIAAGDRTALKILMLQPAGKNRLTAEEFLRGYKIEKGHLFGPG